MTDIDHVAHGWTLLALRRPEIILQRFLSVANRLAMA